MSDELRLEFRLVRNIHDFSSAPDASGHQFIQHCCFIADPDAPDVKACPICQQAGVPRGDSDDILNAEFLDYP